MTSQIITFKKLKSKSNENRYNLNDLKYRKTLVKLDIKKDANIPLPTNNYIFGYKNEVCGYEIISPSNIHELEIKQHPHLYEVVNTETPIFGYIDWDSPDKHTSNPTTVSYNHLIGMCNDLTEYMRKYHNFTQPITYKIHISLLPDDTYKSFLATDNFIISAHIIFSFIVNTANELNQLFITEFVEKYTQYKEFIDPSVYSYRRRLRTLYQQKEQVDKNIPVNGKKFYKYIKQINSDILRLCGIITRNDLISVVIPDDTPIGDYVILQPNNKKLLRTDLPNYIEIPIKPKPILSKYNIKYDINQISELMRHIGKLTDEAYLTKSSWNNTLNLIISVLILSGTQWDALLDSATIQTFLKSSRIGKYDTDEYYQKNIKKIQNRIKKKCLYQHYNDKFIEPLKEDELNFIYEKMKLPNNAEINIITFSVNNDTFLKLSYQIDDAVMTAMYSQKTQIILLNPTISNTKNKKDKIITTVHSTEQYPLIFNNIMKNQQPDENTHLYNIIDVNDLNEVVIEENSNQYIRAEVGSGKSYKVLRKHLLLIANNPNNKILMISDGRSMANKTTEDAIKIFRQEGVQIKNPITGVFETYYNGRKINIVNYQNLKKKTDYSTIDILVCCYDSIHKHQLFNSTHLMIDEFLNVNKRINSTMSKSYKKNKLCEHYFRLCEKCVLKLYDADIDNAVLTIFKTYNIKMTIYNLIGFKQQNGNIIFSNFTDTINKISKYISQGHSITISSTKSKKYLKELSDRLFIKYNVKGVLITAEGASIFGSNDIPSETLKNELITNTSSWEQYQVVIYTPVITTGVSIDNRMHFYTHFHIVQISDKCADATQNAQMLYRVRGNITNTIEICVANNRLTTLQDISIKDTTHIQCDNFNTLINNITNSTNNSYSSIQQCLTNNTRHTFVFNPLFTIQQQMINIEEVQDERKNHSLLYDLFKLAFKYGSHNLICKFYSETYDTTIIIPNDDDEPIEPNKNVIDITRIDETELNRDTLFSFKDYMTFRSSVYLNEIDKSNENELYQFDIQKTYFFKRYNISYYLWSYFNAVHSVLNTLRDRDITVLFNFKEVAFLMLGYVNCGFIESELILKLCNEFIIDIEVKYDDANNIYYNLFKPELTYTEDELNIETDDEIDDETDTEIDDEIETIDFIINIVDFIIDKVDLKIDTVELIKIQNKQINKVITFLSFYRETTEEETDEPVLAIENDPIKSVNQTDHAIRYYDKTLCPWTFGDGIYDHLIGFRKSNNVAYYSIKPIIYKIFKNLLRNTSIGLLDIQKNSINSKDYLYFIELIYGLYICFNIFDMLDLTYHDLQNLYSNASMSIEYEKSEYSSQFKTLFNETAHIGDYILTATHRDKYKKDIQNEQYFKLALSVLHLDIKLGEVREKTAYITRPYKKTSQIYRFQQIAYYNNYLTADISNKLKEEHNIILPPNLIKHINSLDANTVDDTIFWLNNNNIKRTLARNEFAKHSCFPKILAYNPITFEGTEDNPVYPHNNNANTNYLHYGINLCCNNAEELCNELFEINNEIKSKININIINYEEHNLKKCGDLPDKKELKQKTNAVKNANKEAEKIKKEAEKEAKKQENAIKRKAEANEQIQCDKCAGFYIRKYKSSHKCNK